MDLWRKGPMRRVQLGETNNSNQEERLASQRKPQWRYLGSPTPLAPGPLAPGPRRSTGDPFLHLTLLHFGRLWFELPSPKGGKDLCHAVSEIMFLVVSVLSSCMGISIVHGHQNMFSRQIYEDILMCEDMQTNVPGNKHILTNTPLGFQPALTRSFGRGNLQVVLNSRVLAILSRLTRHVTTMKPLKQ